MNLFELAVKIEADTSEAKKSISEYKKDVMNLAQTYKKQGMDMSSAMKKAYSEIDKSQYETAENSKKDSKKFSGHWVDAGEKVSGIANKIGKGLKTAAKIGAAAIGAAAAGITALTTAAVKNYAEYEQLVGGAQKIFNDMDYSKIATDANNAYKELGLSANQYLAVINDVGATFAATMGDEAGYEAAKTGLKAISDYASGTGKNVDELSQKFTLITRSTSSYQSIADQFSGILPATSAGFLEQAQAAGILSDKYKQLTEVPIDEYQAAVSQMLQQGVSDLGLANNTMNEAFSTLSGSLSMAKGAWSNLVTGLADDSADLDMLIGNFVESVGAVATNLIPKIGTALNGASKLVRDLIPVIVQEIPKLINDNLPILAEAAISIIQSLVDGIGQNQKMLMTTAMETITYLATSLVSMLPQIVELGLDLMVSLAEGIVENVDELLPAVLEAIMTIGTALIDHAPELINAGVELASAIMNGVLEQFQGLEPIIMAVVAAFGAYKAITLASEIASKAMAAGQWLVNAAMNANPIMLIVTLIAGLVAAVITLWNTNEGFRNALISAWEAIKGAAETIFNAVASFFTETIPNAFNSVIDWFKGIGSKFAEIGKNIVDGLKNGISNAWKNLTKWFTSLFDDIIGIAKRILGIASPSKVFKKIGGFTAEGFGVGFENEFAKVKDDMEDALNFDDASVGINASIRKVGAGAAGGAFGGTSIGNININIDGAKYSDEQSLASAIALEIQNMTDRRAAVYA